MEEYRKKIRALSSLKKEIEALKAQGKRIVFTNGCFDLLHPATCATFMPPGKWATILSLQ